MKTIIRSYIGIMSLGLMFSCAPEHDSFQQKQSSADFSKYIAIGNSLTAGYADGGLYLEGQKVAYPNLIAQQMQQVGGGTFASPFFDESQANGSGYLRLKALVNGSPEMETVTTNLAVRGLNANQTPLYTKYADQNINNLGVPGMRLDMAFSDKGVGSESGNPYFERLLPEGSSDETRYIDFTLNRDHTFFTFWLGNNDVLGYATNGAVTTDPTNHLTETAMFTALYTNYIEALTAGEKKGAVANIPDVTAVPFFTTVTHALIVAGVKQATNDQVENVFIQTKSGPRLATAEDYFVLTFSTSLLGQPNEAQIPYGFHPANPIEDKYVLDKDEAIAVQKRIGEYNAVIAQIAESKGLALVDVHAFLNKVKTGYVYNGIAISSMFIRGNAFSLDGVHLTPLGNAITANLFIDAINKRYNASIPTLDVSKYPSVKMPD